MVVLLPVHITWRWYKYEKFCIYKRHAQQQDADSQSSWRPNVDPLYWYFSVLQRFSLHAIASQFYFLRSDNKHGTKEKVYNFANFLELEAVACSRCRSHSLS
jgi:hypothetical protein